MDNPILSNVDTANEVPSATPTSSVTLVMPRSLATSPTPLSDHNPEGQLSETDKYYAGLGSTGGGGYTAPVQR